MHTLGEILKTLVSHICGLIERITGVCDRCGGVDLANLWRFAAWES